uniref:VASt domain-containing protein n=1 Tax=Timema monikensis TaxID=170555 RepID=A0A7R9EAH8_9NEOP|nr:unnamed protein product [Timema monikensis]
MSYFLSASKLAVTEYAKSVNRDHKNKHEDNVSRSSDSGGPPVLELSRSLSHESNKDRKESSRNSDRSKKKSSWYNALYPTYKSRSEDFRRIFKDVPPEERLVVECNQTASLPFSTQCIYIQLSLASLQSSLLFQLSLASLQSNSLVSTIPGKSPVISLVSTIPGKSPVISLVSTIPGKSPVILSCFNYPWQVSSLTLLFQLSLASLQSNSLVSTIPGKSPVISLVSTIPGKSPVISLVSTIPGKSPVLLSCFNYPWQSNSLVSTIPGKSPVISLVSTIPGKSPVISLVSTIPGKSPVLLSCFNYPWQVSSLTLLFQLSLASLQSISLVSTIPGKSPVSLKWKDVTAITKEKTALVIPNAVLVCTETDKLFFTSFGARDKTYLMLFRVWQNALMDQVTTYWLMLQQMSMQEMWQWVHSCYGEELGLTSDDEDYIHPVLEEDKISNIGVPLSVDSFVEEFTESPLELPVDCHLDDSLPGLLYRHQQVSPHSPGKRVPGIASISLLSENLPTDMSDTTDSDADKHGGKGEAVVCSSQHEGRKIVRSIFPVHIDQLFTLLFTSSKFFLDFHTIRRTSGTAAKLDRTYMNLSPWQQSPDSGLKQRVVTLTMPLSQSVGPKSTHVCETQIMLPCSKPGQLYAIDSDSVNSGIPYADSFYVTTHYCISRTGENECCLAVYCQIKYKKNVWGIVKSFIEKNTWSGLEDFHTSLTKALQVECDSGIGLGVKKKVRRRRRGLAGITPAEVARPIIGLVEGDGRTLSEMLSWGVMAILVFLVCLNALLYYKLWVLEEWTQNSSHSFTVMDLQVLRFSGTFLHCDGSTFIVMDLQVLRYVPTGSLVRSFIVMDLQVLRFSGTFLHCDGSSGSLVHSFTVMDLQVLWYIPTGSQVHSYSVWSEKNPIKGCSVKVQLFIVRSGAGEPTVSNQCACAFDNACALQPEAPGSSLRRHFILALVSEVFRTPPKSQDEWLRLLQQQEALHNVEMQKWQKVLQAAVQLLRQTEESLSELQVSIHPLVSKKVLSVLKDTFAEEAAAAEALRGELPAEDVVTTETSREEL